VVLVLVRDRLLGLLGLAFARAYHFLPLFRTW